MNAPRVEESRCCLCGGKAWWTTSSGAVVCSDHAEELVTPQGGEVRHIPEMARTLLEKHLHRYRSRLVTPWPLARIRPDELRHLIALWESMAKKGFEELTPEEFSELFDAIMDEE